MAQLRSFTLRNFRSYREATLQFGPVTLLVGANASGKSNAIEGLQMLSWLARGQRLEDVFRAVQDAETSIRGVPTNLARDGEELFSFACKIKTNDWNVLSVEIKQLAGELRIQKESIRNITGNVPLYSVTSGYKGGGVAVAYNNFARGRNKPEIACTDQQAVFTQLLTPARFNAGHKKSQETIPKVCKEFMISLRSILFLDPMPRRMRSPSFADDKKLRGDGSNLSSTLFSLCENVDNKNAVLDFVRDVPEQHITDVRFLKGPRNDVLVQLEETFGVEKRVRDASLLSDGTLRVLAMAAALLSAPEFATVIMEEIDNGIHPSRAYGLLKNVQKVAEARKLAVLITSHNPALLDELPDSAIPDVVFCYRDPEEGDSRLVRLEDLPNYPDLIARGPLGRLITKGILDKMVKNAESPAQRERSGLEYLEGLKEMES